MESIVMGVLNADYLSRDDHKPIIEITNAIHKGNILH